MTELQGRVVLVIGATGGLGSRLSVLLEAAGATVARACRREAAGYLPGDLREAGAAASIVRSVIEQHGRLDGIVIAAGVVAFGPMADVSDAALTELFEVNALGPIRLIREATPYLAASAATGGEPFIVTLSGIVSEAPTAGLAAYSAAKAALAAFTVAATRELRKSSIRLVDARPGHTETALSEHPIEGVAPAFPPGHSPDAVAARILQAITGDEKDLPSSAFGD